MDIVVSNKLTRTPPSAIITMSQSDSNIPLLTKGNIEPEPNVTTRSKRFRAESSSPSDDSNDFRTQMREMKEMMESLQKNQVAVFKKFSDDLGEIKRQNLQIQKTNSDIISKVEAMSISQEKMSARIDNMEKERQKLVNHIQEIDTKLSDLQLNSRTSAVEIRNVPIAENETMDDICNYIIKTGTVTGINTQYSDIRDVYRLPSKPGKPKTIVAEFSSVSHKIKFLSAVRKYNDSRIKENKLNTSMLDIPGPSTPIFVSEYIAGSGRKLFFQCRDFARANNYKYCWVTNNKIYIRKNEHSKTIRVVSEASLNAIEAQ